MLVHTSLITASALLQDTCLWLACHLTQELVDTIPKLHVGTTAVDAYVDIVHRSIVSHVNLDTDPTVQQQHCSS